MSRIRKVPKHKKIRFAQGHNIQTHRFLALEKVVCTAEYTDREAVMQIFVLPPQSASHHLSDFVFGDGQGTY